LTPLVTILQHEALAPPALIGRFLSEAGLRLDVRRLDRGDEVPSTISGSDALVVLGGDMNVGEEAEYPFLLAEQELLREALSAGVPTLGICLGAQQLATAAGGGVTRRETLGLGWHEIAVHRDDPLVDSLDRQTLVFQWRQYACRLPANAKLIASGEGDPQIFRVGDAAWGVQFHPEVTLEVLTSWIDDDPRSVERASRGGREGLLTECRRRLPASTALCGALVADFLAACDLAPVGR
jgi:GMP synthase (glutamine-hydrolysing)